MAVRDSTIASGAGTAAATAVPTNQVDDIVLLAIVQDAASQTPAFPAGFSTPVRQTTTADGQTASYAWKRISGSPDAGSYTITIGSNEWTIAAVALSGRHTTDPPVEVFANSNTGEATPVDVIAASVTAVAGDDLVWFGMPDFLTGSAVTGFTAPTSYPQLEVSFDTNPWTAMGVAARENVSAGATGTVTGLFALAGGNSGWSALHVRVPAAGGAGTAFPRTASDSATVSDAAARDSIAPARTAGDTATVSEAATRSTPKGRTVSDSVTVSDAAVGTAGTSRTAADSITATDAATRAAVARARTGTDTASVSDSAARTSPRARTVTDSATVSDTAARAAGTRARTASDAATIADTAVVTGSVSNLTRTAADSLTVTDAATRATPKARSATDSATVTDQAARAAITRARTSADALSVTDSAAGVPVVTRAAGDTVTVADVLARGPFFLVRGASDVVVLFDAAAAIAGSITPARGTLPIGRVVRAAAGAQRPGRIGRLVRARQGVVSKNGLVP